MDLHPSSFQAVQFFQQTPAAIGAIATQDNRLWVSLEPARTHFSEIELAKEMVDQFSDLPENWDGYGALPISPATIANVKRALDTVCRAAPIPELTPNPNGTLSCEWESPEGYAQLEIGMTRFSFYVSPKAGASIPGDGQAIDVSPEIGTFVAALLFPNRNVARAVTAITYNQPRPPFAA
jgi:hypothetical protein